MFFVLDGSAHVLGGIGRLHCQLGRLGDQRVVDDFARQQFFGTGEFYGRRADIGQRDSDARAGPFAQGQLNGRRRRGEVADLAFELLVGITATRGGGRNAHLGEDFIGLHRRLERAEIKVLGRHHPFLLRAAQHQRRAQRQHHGRMIVARVAVGNVTADGAAVAHLRIGDQARGFGNQRAFVLQQLGGDQLIFGHHGTDVNLAFFLADAPEIVDRIDIDQMGGCRKAQFHHGQQAVTPRQNLRALAVLL